MANHYFWGPVVEIDLLLAFFNHYEEKREVLQSNTIEPYLCMAITYLVYEGFLIWIYFRTITYNSDNRVQAINNKITTYKC